MHRLMALATANSSCWPIKPNFASCASAKADRQLRCLHRVAKACRLNAEVKHLAVRQHKDLLPGTGDALHIHHDDAVGGKDHLIAHRPVGAHDALAVQKQCAGIFADILFLEGG